MKPLIEIEDGEDIAMTRNRTPGQLFKGARVKNVIADENVGGRSADPPEEGASKAPDEHWYKKPIGMLGLSVFGGILVWLARAAFKYFLPGFGG